MNDKETLGSTPDFLYVLDLDRTLINSQVAADAVYQAAEENGISKSELEELQKQVEGSNGSFDVLEAIKQKLSEATSAEETDEEASADELETKLATIKARFLDVIDRDALLYDGAQALIEQLESEDIYIPYVIATYGGEDWQKWKLEAAGLIDKDYIVTTTELEKGAWIAREWLQDDGMYVPPLEEGERKQRLKAKHVVVVDDKRKSFVGLPAGNVSILVRHRNEPVLSSQEEGDYDPDITVGGLGDVTVTLNMPQKGRINS